MQIRDHDAVTLHEKLRKERDRFIRVMADLVNYRRRTERKASRHTDLGKREIILPLLDVVDDIEKALPSPEGGGDQPFVEGIRVIHKRLLALLDAQGVRPYDSIHVMFDHDLHDAVSVAERTGKPAGTVVDELSRGYLWQAGVLRAAKVRVAG